jgi:hypothetical protein
VPSSHRPPLSSRAACDIFDRFVPSAFQPAVFQARDKAVILSEALRRTIANRGLCGAKSKDLGDACWQMLLRAFRPLCQVLGKENTGAPSCNDRHNRGFHLESVAGIPGLKIETWGTLRFLPAGPFCSERHNRTFTEIACGLFPRPLAGHRGRRPLLPEQLLTIGETWELCGWCDLRGRFRRDASLRPG